MGAKICAIVRRLPVAPRDGGFAARGVADVYYCFALPEGLDDEHTAPRLCAGLIGYRALCKAGETRVIGLFVLGAAAHFVAEVAVWEGRDVFAFTRNKS